jgi:hypothetical protein
MGDPLVAGAGCGGGIRTAARTMLIPSLRSGCLEAGEGSALCFAQGQAQAHSPFTGRREITETTAACSVYSLCKVCSPA